MSSAHREAKADAEYSSSAILSTEGKKGRGVFLCAFKRRENTSCSLPFKACGPLTMGRMTCHVIPCITQEADTSDTAFMSVILSTKRRMLWMANKWVCHGTPYIIQELDMAGKALQVMLGCHSCVILIYPLASLCMFCLYPSPLLLQFGDHFARSLLTCLRHLCSICFHHSTHEVSSCYA